MILDCGTGARELGHKLLGEPVRELDLLFTHFHMDHVFGFPFFLPIYTPGYAVRVTMPAYSEEDAKDRLARYLNGEYHPTRLRDLPATVNFRGIRPGRPFSCGAFAVDTVRLNHPGGSVGYRIAAGGRSVAYLTDTAPFARFGDGISADQGPTTREAQVIEFLKGCDTVIYDTMYDLDEYLEKMTWGHSYPEYAIQICRRAGVPHLVLFHHAPDHDDDALDRREARYAEVEGIRVTMAREGGTVYVEG